MKWARLLVLSFVILLALLGLAAWGLLHSEAFWNWSGRRLLEAAQQHLPGTLTVGGIRGTPFTGLTCTEVALTTPQGEVFRAARLSLRFSLWSFVKLQPVIGDLTIERPTLTLYRGLPEPTGLFTPSPSSPGKTAGPLFRSLTFSRIALQGGEVVIVSPSASRHWRNLQLVASLNILHPGRPQQAILARHLHLTLHTPQGPYSLTGRLSYSHQQLDLASLSLQKHQENLLSLTGVVRLGTAEPEIYLTGTFSPLPAAEIKNLWPAWPATLPLAGKFSFKGTSHHLQLTAAVHLAQAAGHLTGALQYHRQGWHYDLSLQLSGLTPEILDDFRPASMSKLPLAGPLTAHLHLKGADLSRPFSDSEASLQLQAFTWGTARVEKLTLTLSAAQGRQNFQGVLQGNGGTLAVTAHGPLTSAYRGDLKVQAENCQPALLGLPLPAGTLLTGSFTGTFRFQDALQLQRLWLAGEVKAAGRLGQHPLHEVRGRLLWNRPRLEIPAARLRLGGVTADLKGHLEENTLDFSCRLSSTPDGGWPWPASWRGRWQADGRLTGSFARPRFSLQGKGRSLSWQGLNLTSADLKLTGAGWPPQDGQLELSGAGLQTPLGHFGQARLTCRGQAGHWRVHLQASSPEGPQAALQGTADLSARPLTFQLHQCRLRRGRLTIHNTTPVRLLLSPGLALEPAAFAVNGGNLQIQAKLAADQATGAFSLHDLPAELFALKGEPLAGKINAHFLLSGSGQAPVLQGQLALHQGRWRNFACGALSTNLSYQANWLQFSGSLVEKTSGPRLTWEGRLPLRFSLLPYLFLWGKEDLQLSVQGDHVSLGLITLLTREVQAAQGEVSLAARWQGKVHRPRLSGAIRWGPGSLTVRQGGLPYRLLPGEIRLSGHSLTIPQLALESGGTAVLSGQIQLAGFLPQELDLRAKLDHFKALRRGGSEALGSGTVTLTGPWASPLLKGHLLIPQATFQTSFFKTARHDDLILVRPPSPAADQSRNADALQTLPQVKMAIVLETPGGVFVKDKLFHVELAGRAVAYKDPGQPAYFGGDLRALQGTVNLHGKAFKVLRGAVHFPGRPRTPVLLEGRCAHELAGLTLFLDVTGPAKKPEVKLSSNPPLPPTDLLSYLVFGQPAQALNREQYLTVGQQMANILGGLTAKKIQDFLGPDFPLVGDLTMIAHEDAMGVAKPLTKDLTISLERKANPIYRDDLNQLRLEYRLNRYFSVESQLGRRNSGGDVLFNLDF